jgi:ABC-type transport system involved in multi-copper enzyme maturation permease subunit
VVRLRPVYLQQANRVPKAVKDSRVAGWFRSQTRWLPAPSLDHNPVLWREWHRNRPSRVVRIVWGAYITITSTVSLKIIWDLLFGPPTGPVGDIRGVYNGFQASFGLLLLAASAGTVLSEERVRGSLDVLLATPLSPRSIVWGKWWGAFRRAPWLAFWPAMIAFASMPKNAPMQVIAFASLVPILLILQGAALAGLGLALATWISRSGRAVTLTIAAVVGSVVGWPIVASLVFSGGGNMSSQNAMAMGSPFWNAGFTTHLIEQIARQGSLNNFEENGALTGLFAWMILYAAAAVSLYLATLATFDRCLGRTSERPGNPRNILKTYRRLRIGNLISEARARKLEGQKVDLGDEING